MLWPGFQSWWGTSTSIWRRLTIDRHGWRWTGDRSVADPAWTRSATSFDPDGWTVRNKPAGALTFAPSGNGKTVPGLPPIAIENAISDGFWSVFSVTRNAVALASGLVRNSTRSAASLS